MAPGDANQPAAENYYNSSSRALDCYYYCTALAENILLSLEHVLPSPLGFTETECAFCLLLFAIAQSRLSLHLSISTVSVAAVQGTLSRVQAAATISLVGRLFVRRCLSQLLRVRAFSLELVQREWSTYHRTCMFDAPTPAHVHNTHQLWGRDVPRYANVDRHHGISPSHTY